MKKERDRIKDKIMEYSIRATRRNKDEISPKKQINKNI